MASPEITDDEDPFEHIFRPIGALQIIVDMHQYMAPQDWQSWMLGFIEEMALGETVRRFLASV